MKCTTIHCNTLQHTATHCNTLQYTAIYCSTLQHTRENVCAKTLLSLCETVWRQKETKSVDKKKKTASERERNQNESKSETSYRRKILRATTGGVDCPSPCNTLQHTATCCNMLQHTVHPQTADSFMRIVTHCNTLQHIDTYRQQAPQEVHKTL